MIKENTWRSEAPTVFLEAEERAVVVLGHCKNWCIVTLVYWVARPCSCLAIKLINQWRRSGCNSCIVGLLLKLITYYDYVINISARLVANFPGQLRLVTSLQRTLLTVSYQTSYCYYCYWNCWRRFTIWHFSYTLVPIKQLQCMFFITHKWLGGWHYPS